MPLFGFPFFNEVQLFSLMGFVMVATAIIHIAFAAGVSADAQLMVAGGRRPLFGPPWVWSLTVLVGGLPSLLIYWLFHHAFQRQQL